MEKTKDIYATQRKRNLKLYPIYQMIGYDLLFFYAVKVMFLKEIKHIPDSQIVLLLTIYCITVMIVQFPMTILTITLGNKNSAVIGNIINMLSVITFILAPNYTAIVIAQILLAIGFTLKYTADLGILDISTPESKNKQNIELKIDRNGYSKYYALSAITTIASGFLYNVNAYLPFLLSLFFVILSTIFSFNFYDFEKKNLKEEKKKIKDNYKNLKKGFKITAGSKRLKALFLFIGLIMGISALIGTYNLTLLDFFNMPSIYTGLVYAGFELSKALASKRAIKFNKKFANRSLTNIALTISMSLIIIGVISILKLPVSIILIIAIPLMILMFALIGISDMLKRKYLNNFSNSKMSPPIFSSRIVIEQIFKIMFTYLGSAILNYATIDYAFLTIGIALTLCTFVAEVYSKNKLGLAPEQYSKKDNFNK